MSGFPSVPDRRQGYPGDQISRRQGLEQPPLFALSPRRNIASARLGSLLVPVTSPLVAVSKSRSLVGGFVLPPRRRNSSHTSHKGSGLARLGISSPYRVGYDSRRLAPSVPGAF
jgi:hypothetical protein